MEKYYRHFKGNVYRLVGIAKDSETLAEMVVYQAMYGEGQMWVRPKEMFFGEVERDGKRISRRISFWLCWRCFSRRARAGGSAFLEFRRGFLTWGTR